MRIDYTSFEKAVQRLKNNIKLHNSHIENIDVQEAFKDACIKAFEFSYDQAYKVIKRYLEESEANKEQLDHATFKEIILLATERGISSAGMDAWFEFREARNKSSHSYSGEYAAQILAMLPEFMLEVDYMLHKLHRGKI